MQEIEEEEEHAVLGLPLGPKAGPKTRAPRGSTARSAAGWWLDCDGRRGWQRPSSAKIAAGTEAGPLQDPAGGESGQQVGGQEEEVVAGDRVGNELQEEGELRPRSDQVVGEGGGPRGRIVEGCVPEVGKAEGDLPGGPLQDIEVEERIVGAGRQVVPAGAPDRTQVEDAQQAVEGQQQEPDGPAAPPASFGLRDRFALSSMLGKEYLCAALFGVAVVAGPAPR
jgi:hypothetical protein